MVFQNYNFTKGFLSIENVFYEIISSIAAIGVSINDKRVVEALGKVIEFKTGLANGYNAWDQYEHMARWLIYIASILEIKGTSIEKVFLEATLRSMNTMRKELYIGYSWHAYNSWNNRWSGIIASNRVLIRDYIVANTAWPDALQVVNRN